MDLENHDTPEYIIKIPQMIIELNQHLRKIEHITTFMNAELLHYPALVLAGCN